MEGKALEILALQLGALSSSSLRKTTVANRAERERLEEARRIPDTEYSDPPSLLDLSRSVGLNDFKLNRGFRDVYRTTAFGYIHELRMERALGYTCFGHFSVAFRKRFGMSPGAVKRAYGGK